MLSFLIRSCYGTYKKHDDVVIAPPYPPRAYSLAGTYRKFSRLLRYVLHNQEDEISGRRRPTDPTTHPPVLNTGAPVGNEMPPGGVSNEQVSICAVLFRIGGDQ